MTTYTWTIVSLEAYPQQDGETDVVFQVNWQCVATEPKAVAEEPPYRAATNGAVSVTYEAGSPFTPYDQLTEQQVWGWVDPQIDRPAIKANLQSLIDARKNPQEVTPPLPWATPA